MRIANISTMPAGEWGGSEEYWYRTAVYAVEQGHRVLASFPYDGGCHEKIRSLRASGVTIHYRTLQGETVRPALRQRVIKRLVGNWAHARYLDRLLREFREFAPDIVLVNQGGSYTLFKHADVVFLINRLDVPLCLFSHLNDEHKAFPYADIQQMKRTLSKFRKTYFVSRRNLDMVRHQLACSDLGDAEVLNNMCKLPAMAPLSYPAGKVVQFAVVARLNTKHKGQDFALAALALNEWESRKWHLNFYGTGSDADYLADLVEFYGLNERVSFHGHVHDIADVWRRNHALLLTSIAEGAPQALIEAMYCGRIGIVTDVGDSACLVEDERNGFIIPAPTICLVSRTLEKAWRKRNEWPEMGESAAQDIRRYIDPNPERTLLAKLATLAS